MIFLGNSSNKTFALFALVLILGGAIFLKWFKIGPIGPEVSESESTWQSIGTKVGEVWTDITSEIEVTKYESQQTWEEYKRQNQEEEFIENIKQYLENYSTSTYSTSTEENQDEEQGEDTNDNR